MACTPVQETSTIFLQRRTRVDGTADNAVISQSQAASDDRPKTLHILVLEYVMSLRSTIESRDTRQRRMQEVNN